MTRQICDDLLFDCKRLNLPPYKFDPFGGLANSKKIEERFKQVRRSSACWRGYIASWVIEEMALKLTALTDDVLIKDTEEEQGINLVYELYHDIKIPVFANWVTGEFEASHGNIIGRCGQYEPIYEEYYTLQIENGLLMAYHKCDGQTWKVINDCETKNTKFMDALNGIYSY